MDRSYKLQMQSHISGLPWEYNFEIASDVMAQEYVIKYLETGKSLPENCRSVILWATATPERFIAEYRIETRTIACEIPQRR